MSCNIKTIKGIEKPFYWSDHRWGILSQVVTLRIDKKLNCRETGWRVGIAESTVIKYITEWHKLVKVEQQRQAKIQNSSRSEEARRVTSPIASKIVEDKSKIVKPYPKLMRGKVTGSILLCTEQRTHTVIGTVVHPMGGRRKLGEFSREWELSSLEDWDGSISIG